VGAAAESTAAAIVWAIVAEELLPCQPTITLSVRFAPRTTVRGFFPLQAATRTEGEDRLEIGECVGPLAAPQGRPWVPGEVEVGCAGIGGPNETLIAAVVATRATLGAAVRHLLLGEDADSVPTGVPAELQGLFPSAADVRRRFAAARFGRMLPPLRAPPLPLSVSVRRTRSRLRPRLSEAAPQEP